ncbi:type II toxin-antitoxin system HigB family toxin [Paraburkholderia sp. GAS448]|uniref:type II toxin-antitoxin system HigB family toxin n=1 Tax=Paraburkholderia sp. GAS448 TaxID=3035136 RepID=UPI003D1904D7
MRVISDKTLVEIATRHVDAGTPLRIWRKTVEAGTFANFADLKKAFNATDNVGDYYVFDVGGNKYRMAGSLAGRNENRPLRACLLDVLAERRGFEPRIGY